MISKRNRLFIYIIFLAGIIFIFSGFQNYSPIIKLVKAKKYYDSDNVINIFFQISSNLIDLINSNEDNTVSAITKSGKTWSMFSTKSNVNINYVGKTDRDMPISFEEVNCDEDDDNEELHNSIIASNEEDPDCTGPACTYIWSCEDKNRILHSDIQLNFNNFNIRAENIENDIYDLQTIVTHHLGHAIGLTHCSVGDTSESCENKISDNMSDPPEESLMYKLIISGVIKTDISNDDKDGIVELYGQLDPEKEELQNEIVEFLQEVDERCPFILPEYETNPKYVLSPEENNHLVEYRSLLEEKGLNTYNNRKDQAILYQKWYMQAYTIVGKPAERYLLKVLDKKDEYNADISIEGLQSMRGVIVSNIEELNSIITDFGNELDPQFLEFTQANLQIIIQIRKSIIDEISNR